MSQPSTSRSGKAAVPAREALDAGAVAGPDGGSRDLDAVELGRDVLELHNEELKKAHAELEISHQRFSELHEQAPLGYVTFDFAGCIREVNAAAAALLGVTRGCVLGKPFVVYVEKGDRKKFFRHLSEARRAESAAVTDLRLVAGEGRVLLVQMTTALHRDAEGRSALLLSAIEDVTELRSVSAGAAYLASIVESSQDKIISYSLDGIIRSWNPGAQKLLGYAPAEVIGRHASVIVPAGKLDEFNRNLRIVGDGGMVAAHETMRRHKDGTFVPMEQTISPVREGRRVVAVMVIGRDVSERKRAEALRRESEERFGAILENSLDAAYRRNLRTNTYDYISPAIETITGYSPEEMGAQGLNTVLKHMHPADIRHVKRAIKKAIATGKPCQRLEYRFLRKDGGVCWVSESFRIVPDSSGRPLHLVGTVRNTTERRQMEEELRESQRLAHATVEAIPAHIAVVARDGTILETNKAWRRFARENGGNEAVTGPGVNYLEVCHRVHGFDRGYAARFEKGIRAVAAGRRRIFSMEYPCHSPAEKRWFTAFVTPFEGPGERRMVVAHVNITAAKLAEERFRGVVESTPDAMVIVNREGTIRLVNRQAERLFGYTRKAMIGRRVEMLMPAAFRGAHKAQHGVFMATPSIRPMGTGLSLFGRRKDGREFPVEISLSPLESATELLVCSVVRDVTERKRAEEAINRLNAELEERVAARTAELQASNEELLRSTEELRKATEDRRRLEAEIIEISESERQRIAQDLHDDLGQQLAGLRCLSRVLEQNLKAASSPEAASAAKLGDYLGNSLALTRSLARGLHPVSPEPGGLQAALQELAARSSELFRVRCDVRCAKSVHIPDPNMATHLYRIAQEAVTNAIKHGEAKRIGIALASAPGKIVLRVNDDGRGLQKPRAGHRGLGVRTMHYRAETLGGALVFRKKPGGGTSVVCTVPAGKTRRTGSQP